MEPYLGISNKYFGRILYATTTKKSGFKSFSWSIKLASLKSSPSIIFKFSFLAKVITGVSRIFCPRPIFFDLLVTTALRLNFFLQARRVGFEKSVLPKKIIFISLFDIA